MVGPVGIARPVLQIQLPERSLEGILLTLVGTMVAHQLGQRQIVLTDQDERVVGTGGRCTSSLVRRITTYTSCCAGCLARVRLCCRVIARPVMRVFRIGTGYSKDLIWLL